MCVFYFCFIRARLASGGFAKARKICNIETWTDYIAGSSASAVNLFALSSNRIVLDTQTTYQIITVHFTA